MTSLDRGYSPPAMDDVRSRLPTATVTIRSMQCADLPLFVLSLHISGRAMRLQPIWQSIFLRSQRIYYRRYLRKTARSRSAVPVVYGGPHQASLSALFDRNSGRPHTDHSVNKLGAERSKCYRPAGVDDCEHVLSAQPNVFPSIEPDARNVSNQRSSVVDVLGTVGEYSLRPVAFSALYPSPLRVHWSRLHVWFLSVLNTAC